MPCVTIMIIIKLIKPVHHVDIYIYIYLYIDDLLKYTFHLALSSPIKISISYITSSLIIELKLEIKLIYSLHLNRLLNFLRYHRRAHCTCCSKLVNSQQARRRQSGIAARSYALRMPGSKPWAHHLIILLTPTSCCISLRLCSSAINWE